MAQAESTLSFTWLSPLGISVGLFLICVLVYVAIPLAGAFALHRYGVAAPQTAGQFILSAKADEVWFGSPPAEVVKENPRVGKLMLLFMDFMMGFMFGFGILLLGIVWFGLRQVEGTIVYGSVYALGLVLLAIGSLRARKLPAGFP
jgi:hypothetical protein